MWQWYTYFCGAVTPAGRSNFARIVVKLPGFALTVSLNPRSLGSGGCIGPVAKGVGSCPPGTPCSPSNASSYACTSNGVRPTTWKVTRCVCIGCVSPVMFT
jgi:hypothetical protein